MATSRCKIERILELLFEHDNDCQAVVKDV